MASLQVLAYSLGLTTVVLFGIAAVLYALWRQHIKGADTPEFFLTARRSVGAFTITWAFYAGAMGSWALFSPPSYVSFAGPLGLIFYAIASGIPIIVVAALGGIVHELVPNVLSFSDFVNRRFGLGVSLYVALIMLFNMGIAITAEYTAVGDLFEFILGVNRIPIVVTIGVVSVLYTAVGGLFVSIITDQWQAGISVIFILILVIYVAATFRYPLPPLADVQTADLTWSNEYGLASIAVMPISLITSTLFSEAMWQRCWATSTRRSLLIGSSVACVLVIAAVFLFGFGGLLAIWGGLWVPDDPVSPTNTNIILFTLFGDQTWLLIIVCLLSVCMSESAVDSLQNAIVDTIASSFATIATALEKSFPAIEGKMSFMKDLNIWWIRVLVLVLNVPPVVVSLQGFSVIQLFLLANLITTCTAVPVCLGLIQGRISRMIITPFSVMLGCLTGFLSLFWWNAISANMLGMSYNDTLYNTFLVAFDYQPFLIGLGMSIVGLILGAAIEFVFRKASKDPRWSEYPAYDLGRDDHISDSTADAFTKGYEMETEKVHEDDIPKGSSHLDGPAVQDKGVEGALVPPAAV